MNTTKNIWKQTKANIGNQNMIKQEDKYQNNEQDRRIVALEYDIGAVKDHIAITNTEMGKVQKDVEWLVKSHWIIASAAIGSVVVGLINLVMKK